MAKKYDVGYGKPPQHTRFKKGRSGNPAGRPKGAMSLQDEMKQVLRTKTNIKINGDVKRVPTARALCLMLKQKAMAGDVRAFSKIADIVGPEIAEEFKSLSTALAETDLDILRRALEPEGEPKQEAEAPATYHSDEDET